MVPALLNILGEKSNPGRIEAAQVLGAFKSREAISVLLGMLQDEYQVPRLAAVSALQVIDEPLLVSSLTEMLNHERLTMRQEAVRLLLGRTRSAEAVPALIDALLSNVQEVRHEIASSLEHPGTPGFFFNPAVITALAGFLLHENPEVHRFVVRALRSIYDDLEDATVIPILLDAANAKDPETRAVAAHVLRFVKSKAAIPALAGILSHKATVMRMAAAAALRRTGDKAGIPPLVKALQDNDPEVRKRVVWALAEIGAAGDPDDVLPKLTRVLHQDADPQVRIEAAVVLEAMEAVAAWPTLIEALDDECEEVRQEVMTIVSRLEGIATADVLSAALNMLHDKHGGVRRAAASALAGISNPEAAIGLIEVLQDSDIEIREVASEGLGSFGEMAVAMGAVPALINAMRAETTTFQHTQRTWKTAEALGAIGNPSAIPDLLNLLRNGHSSELRFQAAVALDRMGESIATADAAPVLLQALCDDSEYVRMMAARMLGTISESAVSAGAKPRLMALLKNDQSTIVKSTAAEVLGVMGYMATEVVRDLIGRLQNWSQRQDEHIQEIQALGRLGEIMPPAEIIPALADLLGYALSHGFKWPVRHIADALREIGTPEALAVLDEYEVN